MDLTSLKGIGEKTSALFAKIGVNSAEELLGFFPRDYEVYQAPVSVAGIGHSTFAAVSGAFTGSLFTRRGGKLKITTGSFRDEFGGQIRVCWFNAPFVRDAVDTSKRYVLRGRISRKYGQLQIDQPKIFELDAYLEMIGNIVPIYPVTKGLNSNLIAKAVRQAMDCTECMSSVCADPIPHEIREKYDLCTREYAIRNIHFPGSDDAFRQAASRLSFEEIFLFIMTMKLNEDRLKKDSGFIIRRDERTAEFVSSLPFELTRAQYNVLEEIRGDMASGKVMNRLVQGDVGSGKTIVALISMMDAAFAGYQCALMAPTEVLARQHFETISSLFRNAGVSLHVSLLTGSMTPLEKKAVCDALEDGRVDIAVGTHALFQEKVSYKNLALVITDEQHRFGIKQRETLAGKGSMPHMMVMSATPIPRTLALIIYGNMDVSVIDERPADRLPIKNAVIDESYLPNAIRLIEREVKAGHQAYVICPLIDYSDGIDAQNVEDYTEQLREALDPHISIAKLHGQMKPDKKNEIMEQFACGKVQVLVSTTVIEVGVDAPNATVMMIEDADRFGLAQLHQLRGRVGRGKDQSYCIFVCNKRSEQAKERLEILKTSNDGFEIASKDLDMRGPGEFTGVRQSGAVSFKFFDLGRDTKIASRALEACECIMSGSVLISEEEERELFLKTSLLKSGILL